MSSLSTRLIALKKVMIVLLCVVFFLSACNDSASPPAQQVAEPPQDEIPVQQESSIESVEVPNDINMEPANDECTQQSSLDNSGNDAGTPRTRDERQREVWGSFAEYGLPMEVGILTDKHSDYVGMEAFEEFMDYFWADYGKYDFAVLEYIDYFDISLKEYEELEETDPPMSATALQQIIDYARSLGFE